MLLRSSILITCWLVLAAEVLSIKRTYEGYSLYRCTPRTQEQIDVLSALKSDRRLNGVEFWKEPGSVNAPVDIMTSPEEEPHFRRLLRSEGIRAKKIMFNVGDVIKRTSKSLGDLECRNLSNATRYAEDLLNPSVFHNQFNRYQTIEAKLRELAQNPKVTLQTIGLSSERRNLYLVKVSNNHEAGKPVIFLDAGHHAREWISHSTLLYILESLVNSNVPTRSAPRFTEEASDENDIPTLKQSELPNNNSSLASLLNDYDFWFIPVVNPDGYEYSHSSDRLWRKTRSSGALCTGVDPNRNYPFHWAERGASSFSCAETYAGPSAASEPEVASVVETLFKNRERIVMYLSLHAYSQLILTPYGYGRVYPDNYADLSRVAEVGAKAIYSSRRTLFRTGVSSIILYPAAGGSDDYAHGVANIKIAFTIELPDEGSFGFLAPQSEIVPVGQETALGLAAMVKALK